MSARYAGMVAKPPPYMVRMMQKMTTKRVTLPVRPANGPIEYSRNPKAKKVK